MKLLIFILQFIDIEIIIFKHYCYNQAGINCNGLLVHLKFWIGAKGRCCHNESQDQPTRGLGRTWAPLNRSIWQLMFVKAPLIMIEHYIDVSMMMTGKIMMFSMMMIGKMMMISMMMTRQRRGQGRVGAN